VDGLKKDELRTYRRTFESLRPTLLGTLEGVDLKSKEKTKTKANMFEINGPQKVREGSPEGRRESMTRKIS